jgi:hypothetical protein
MDSAVTFCSVNDSINIINRIATHKMDTLKLFVPHSNISHNKKLY